MQVPKRSGVRPIATLGRRAALRGGGGTALSFPPINAVVAAAFHALQYEATPELLGASVFSYADVFARLRVPTSPTRMNKLALCARLPFFYEQVPHQSTTPVVNPTCGLSSCAWGPVAALRGRLAHPRTYSTPRGSLLFCLPRRGATSVQCKHC